MENKGLTITMIFEADSMNYGESIGNVSVLKKYSRGNGNQHTFISRQAIRYSIVEQMLGKDKTLVADNDKVLQYLPSTNITNSPEIDLFGYMKTKTKNAKNKNAHKETKKRSAKVRISNAESLEAYNGDLEFLTNKGLADRIGANSNIAQLEKHVSLYRYTVSIDLDQIGIDEDEEIPNSEKAKRVNKLLRTISLLRREVKARNGDLKPKFVIGGIYDTKNPLFQNYLDVKDNKINIDTLEDIIGDEFKEHTECGFIRGVFDNDLEIQERLNGKKVSQVFTSLQEKVSKYYESN